MAVGLGIFLPVVALTSALTFPASTSGNRRVSLKGLKAGWGCVTSGAEKHEQRNTGHSTAHVQGLAYESVCIEEASSRLDTWVRRVSRSPVFSMRDM